MGVVYRARDPIINRLVALKTITAAGADDPNMLERFYREAQSAGGLQHPNIVTIYDMGDEGGVPYIAMELIEGENLEQLISRRTPIPLSLKIVYATQACSALDYAHKRGIIHRDIKPGNIMVNKDGTVKVVDFGIARVLEASKTQTGMLIGTFAYMSPEQYHGEHADERSDIWSFGVLLYELLALQRPFAGTTPAALMHSICSQEPSPLRNVSPDIPEELETVVCKLLQKSPDDRFQSMEDLLFNLDPICKNLQVASVAEMVAQSQELAEREDYSRARDLLRQALLVDSKNATARMLLEKVNAELRRVTIRPKAQQQVEKGKALLDEGKIEEAKAAADGALEMDSSFEPAQELRRSVQKELDRVQRVADWLDGAKQRLAEGMPEEAEALLAKVIDAEPSNKQARMLLEQASKQKAERERRLQLIEKMQAARSLWTRQKYTDCIQLLTELQKHYPDAEEVSRLLQTAREDQVEQEREQNLDRARNLLATRRYDECRSLLAELQKTSPNDEEVSNLLQELREDEDSQRKLQRLTEARSLLASRAFDKCISLLSVLEKEYPHEHEVGKLLDTARRERLEDWKKQRLAKARMLMASRQYKECNALLEDLHKQFPADDEVPRLLEAVVEAQKEQHKLEALAEVRKLLAAHRHQECIALLTTLQKEFPGKAEIQSLLDTVHEDEAEQRKLQTLVEARHLLVSRRFDECIALLTELQKAFPEENDITKLLEAAREEEADQQKQQKLIEARSLFVAERFDDALRLLEALGTAHPKDSGIQKLRTAVLQEKEKHAQAEKLKSDIAVLKKLVSEKKYPEVLARAEKQVVEHLGNADLKRLIEFARSQQAEIERELAVHKALDEGQSLLKANRFDEAARAIQMGLKAHSDNRELLNLREQVEAQRRKSFTRQVIEQRIREIKVKINREKFSEAIDLAKRTIATIGPDTDVTQLLNSAQVEIEARERKRHQEKTIESIRELVQAGQFDEAKRALDGAVSKKLFDPFDSRAERAAEEILAARNAVMKELASPAPVAPGNLTKEYAFLQAPPVPDTPPTFDTLTSSDSQQARGSIAPQMSSGPPAPAPLIEPAQQEKTVQGSTPGVAEPPTPKISKLTQTAKPTQRVIPVERPRIAEPKKPTLPVKPAQTTQPTAPVVPAGPTKAGPPAEPVPQVEKPTPKPFAPVIAEPEYHEEPKKKRLLAAVLAIVSLCVVGTYFLWPGKQVKIQRPASSNTPLVTPVNPLEVKQRSAIHEAEKLVAANDLENALQTVLDAEKLNGPLTAELQKMQGQIEDSIKDTRLRQVRQREAQLWQQASDKMKSQRYAEAQNYLRQLLALPEGGVHRDEAQTDLTDVIPRLQQQGKFLAQARQALRQGDFGTARSFASQIQRIGGDTSQLNEEIDKSEADYLAQLESEFKQLKEAADDAAVQQLRTLQTKFKMLSNDGGPKFAEAQSYFDNTATAISDVQARVQNRRLEAAFQSAVQKYQQALNAADKNVLASASGALQPFAQGGPHAAEAQKYLSEINAKLTAMNKPPTVEPPPVSTTKREAPASSPVESDAGVRAVVLRYKQAFEQRDADALRQIWPSMGGRYKKFKEGFGAARAIQMQLDIVEVKMGADGVSAMVRAVHAQNYTPKNGDKTKTSKDQIVFYMVKSNGNWLIARTE